MVFGEINALLDIISKSNKFLKGSSELQPKPNPYCIYHSNPYYASHVEAKPEDYPGIGAVVVAVALTLLFMKHLTGWTPIDFLDLSYCHAYVVCS